MRIQKINDNWKYWIEKDAFALVWNVPEDASTVKLPHDAMLESKAYAESRNGGNTGYRDGDVYNYVKILHVCEEDKNRTLFLKFEGIYMNAMVYVNGALTAKCPYGYTGFYVELNRYVNYGEDNEIRVIVRNSGMANSRWYSGGGIYRDVLLLTASEIFVVPDETHVITKYLDEDQANLQIIFKIRNRKNQTSDLSARIAIYNAKQELVTQIERPVSLVEKDEKMISFPITVKNPSCWSDDNPYLYQYDISILDKDCLLDEEKNSFGIRTILVDSQKGLRINGKETKLRGACIHHDSGILGAATFYDAEYRRIQILKEAGFNAIRISHQPISIPMLKACDELGMYVMDEAFDMWTRCKSDNDYALFFGEWWQRDLQSMVKKDFNHPSVIMYSIGNEIPEIGSIHGSMLCHDMVQKVKELDETRPVTAAINGVFASGDAIGKIMGDIIAEEKAAGKPVGNVNNFMQMMDTHMDAIVCHDEVSKRLDRACAFLDISGYNYMTARYEKDKIEKPDRVMVGSETYPPEIARNWKIIKEQSDVIGDFTWTGWDYIGEAGVGIPAYQWGEGGFGATFPAQLAYTGDIDITGFRRPLSYYRQIVFGLTDEPYIAVQNPYKYGNDVIKTPWVMSDAVASWNYPEMEDKPVVVEVYSTGDEVELIQNGESLGKKASGESVNFYTTFDTKYDLGELVAISYKNGKEIGRKTLKSSGKTDKILLVPEKGKGNELVFVTILLVDANDNCVTSESGELQLQVTGNAKACFGSADPKPVYNYLDNKAKFWNGRALAVIRKDNPDEEVVVEVVSGNLKQQITI